MYKLIFLLLHLCCINLGKGENESFLEEETHRDIFENLENTHKTRDKFATIDDTPVEEETHVTEDPTLESIELKSDDHSNSSSPKPIEDKIAIGFTEQSENEKNVTDKNSKIVERTNDDRRVEINNDSENLRYVELKKTDNVKSNHSKETIVQSENQLTEKRSVDASHAESRFFDPSTDESDKNNDFNDSKGLVNYKVRNYPNTLLDIKYRSGSPEDLVENMTPIPYLLPVTGSFTDIDVTAAANDKLIDDYNNQFTSNAYNYQPARRSFQELQKECNLNNLPTNDTTQPRIIKTPRLFEKYPAHWPHTIDLSPPSKGSFPLTAAFEALSNIPADINFPSYLFISRSNNKIPERSANVLKLSNTDSPSSVKDLVNNLNKNLGRSHEGRMGNIHQEEIPDKSQRKLFYPYRQDYTREDSVVSNEPYDVNFKPDVIFPKTARAYYSNPGALIQQYRSGFDFVPLTLRKAAREFHDNQYRSGYRPFRTNLESVKEIDAEHQSSRQIQEKQPSDKLKTKVVKKPLMYPAYWPRSLELSLPDHIDIPFKPFAAQTDFNAKNFPSYLFTHIQENRWGFINSKPIKAILNNLEDKLDRNVKRNFVSSVENDSQKHTHIILTLSSRRSRTLRQNKYKT